MLCLEKVGTFLLMLPKKISGPVFSFEFRIKNNAAPGTYEIGAEASFGDVKGSNVDVTGAEIRVNDAHTPTVNPNEETTEPKPPVQETIPTTGDTTCPEETTSTTEQTCPEETILKTEQTQPSLPTQSQQQPEITTPVAPTEGTTPAKKANGCWWLLIPLFLGCGIVAIALLRKPK